MDSTEAVTESLISYAKRAGVKIYYVGGIVRDMLLGVSIKDIDIVVEGNAIEFCRGFTDEYGGSKGSVSSVRNRLRKPRELGNGHVQILSVHSDFGTCKMRIGNTEIDFASTREEIYPQSGCLPVVKNIGCELKHDILRRDFTVNAIALDLESGEIIDYVGGIEDLKAKKLKTLHSKSFIDDPTRILRALDFELRLQVSGAPASSSGFKLQDEIQFSETREGLSFARVDLTLSKLFSGPKPLEAYERIIKQKLYKIFQDEAPKISPQKLKRVVEKFCTDTSAVYLKAVKNALPELLIAQTNYEIYKALRLSLKCSEIKQITPLITGDDLIALGIPEGPKIGEILEKLLEIKLNTPEKAPKTREEELELATRL